MGCRWLRQGVHVHAVAVVVAVVSPSAHIMCKCCWAPAAPPAAKPGRAPRGNVLPHRADRQPRLSCLYPPQNTHTFRTRTRVHARRPLPLRAPSPMPTHCSAAAAGVPGPGAPWTRTWGRSLTCCRLGDRVFEDSGGLGFGGVSLDTNPAAGAGACATQAPRVSGSSAAAHRSRSFQGFRSSAPSSSLECVVGIWVCRVWVGF